MSGWTWRKVADLAADEPNAITDGPFGSKLKTEHYVESGPRVVRLQNIGDCEFIDAKACISDEHYRTLLKHQVRPGDLVIAALGERLPRACIIPRDFGPAIVKADCIRLKVNENIASPKFVLYALNAPAVQVQAASIIHGVGRPRLNQAEIKSLAIPLPPSMQAQDEIVAAIERQFTRVDAGVAGLRRVRTEVRRYRAAVLNCAWSGCFDEITTDALRAQTDHAIPTAPTGWQLAQLGSLVSTIEAGRSFRCEERPPRPGEVGIVKVSAVTWGRFNADESKTITDSARVDPRLIIRSGDFLFSRANTIELVGACVIADSVNRHLILSDKILRLQIAGASPAWVLWMLRSPRGRAEIERLATGNQESMRNIGQDRIRQIEIPVPTMAEQQRGVEWIEARMDTANQIEAAVSHCLARAAKLRRAVLGAAFGGALQHGERIPNGVTS